MDSWTLLVRKRLFFRNYKRAALWLRILYTELMRRGLQYRKFIPVHDPRTRFRSLQTVFLKQNFSSFRWQRCCRDLRWSRQPCSCLVRIHETFLHGTLWIFRHSSWLDACIRRRSLSVDYQIRALEVRSKLVRPSLCLVPLPRKKLTLAVHSLHLRRWYSDAFGSLLHLIQSRLGTHLVEVGIQVIVESYADLTRQHGFR